LLDELPNIRSLALTISPPLEVGRQPSGETVVTSSTLYAIHPAVGHLCALGDR
jgi:hypothetical protein